jgi:hypothetical protein
MAVRQKVKFLISASFWGIVIGLVALYYTVRGTRTNLVVDVGSESNVMDVRTPLKDLAILFQGQDIQKENANLRILGVRLVNEGESNILENYFDSKIPWGLRIQGGRLIEARITGSNSKYLSENLHPSIVEKDEVTFDKVIFDKGKYIALELLVLHDKNVEPVVVPIGKIAGMDQIPVRNSFRERDQEGLTGRVFKGPIAVQIARTIAYFLIGLCIIVVIGFAVAGIGSIPSWFRKRSRRKQVRYLIKEGSPEKEKKRQILVDVFVEEGGSGLSRLQAALNDAELLAKAVTDRRVHIRNQAELPPHAKAHMVPDGYIVVHEASPLDTIVQAGLIRRNGTKIEVDPDLPALLTNLIGQLSDPNEKSDNALILAKPSTGPEKE